MEPGSKTQSTLAQEEIKAAAKTFSQSFRFTEPETERTKEELIELILEEIDDDPKSAYDILRLHKEEFNIPISAAYEAVLHNATDNVLDAAAAGIKAEFRIASQNLTVETLESVLDKLDPPVHSEPSYDLNDALSKMFGDVLNASAKPAVTMTKEDLVELLLSEFDRDPRGFNTVYSPLCKVAWLDAIVKGLPDESLKVALPAFRQHLKQDLEGLEVALLNEMASKITAPKSKTRDTEQYISDMMTKLQPAFFDILAHACNKK